MLASRQHKNRVLPKLIISLKRNQLDVGMSSIQAYKAHKQEGTIAATTLVSKVHKQGALGTSSKASLHQWLHCMSITTNIVSLN